MDGAGRLVLDGDGRKREGVDKMSGTKVGTMSALLVTPIIAGMMMGGLHAGIVVALGVAVTRVLWIVVASPSCASATTETERGHAATVGATR